MRGKLGYMLETLVYLRGNPTSAFCESRTPDNQQGRLVNFVGEGSPNVCKMLLELGQQRPPGSAEQWQVANTSCDTPVANRPTKFGRTIFVRPPNKVYKNPQRLHAKLLVFV